MATQNQCNNDGCNCDSDNMDKFVEAVQSNDIQIIRQMLESEQIDFNWGIQWRDKAITTFLFALTEGGPEIAKCLIDNCEDVTQFAGLRGSYLQIAIKKH